MGFIIGLAVGYFGKSLIREGVNKLNMMWIEFRLNKR